MLFVPSGAMPPPPSERAGAPSANSLINPDAKYQSAAGSRNSNGSAASPNTAVFPAKGSPSTRSTEPSAGLILRLWPDAEKSISSSGIQKMNGLRAAPN